MTTNIVALGGGGFSEEADNSALDDYILAMTRTAKPRVCFLPTASGDAQGYVDKFLASYPSTRAEATCLPLFRPSGVGDIRSFLMKQHVIYVGGGSTVNLLSLWRTHGLDGILRDAWHGGVVLAGISAGMVCWFDEFLTDSYLDGALRPCRQGFGLIPGSACPHYDDMERRRTFRDCVAANALAGGVGAEGCVGLHYVDGVLAKVVTSRQDRRAYRVQVVDGRVSEEPLEATVLPR